MNVAFESAFVSFVAKRRQALGCALETESGSAERTPAMSTNLELIEGLSSFFSVAWEVTRSVIVAGFDAAPALVIGLAVVAALPFLIASGALVRKLAPADGRSVRTQRIRFSAEDDVVKARTGADRVSRQPVFSEAIITVESDEEGDARDMQEPFRFGRALMVRIGREEDNEILLRHPTVHRYHALIRRSYDEGYEIADLSDETGNGVRVNGKKVTHGRLVDGDLIELGAARLRFSITA
jgi:FHA domain